MEDYRQLNSYKRKRNRRTRQVKRVGAGRVIPVAMNMQTGVILYGKVHPKWPELIYVSEDKKNWQEMYKSMIESRINRKIKKLGKKKIYLS